jgi:hypothetical protein
MNQPRPPRQYAPTTPAVIVTSNSPDDYAPSIAAAPRTKTRPAAEASLLAPPVSSTGNVTFAPSAAGIAQAGVQLPAPMQQQDAPAPLPAIEPMPEDESQLSPVERLTRREADWHRAMGALTDAYRSGHMGAIMKLQQRQFDAMVARNDAAQMAHDYLAAQRRP